MNDRSAPNPRRTGKPSMPGRRAALSGVTTSALGIVLGSWLGSSTAGLAAPATPTTALGRHVVDEEPNAALIGQPVDHSSPHQAGHDVRPEQPLESTQAAGRDDGDEDDRDGPFGEGRGAGREDDDSDRRQQDQFGFRQPPTISSRNGVLRTRITVTAQRVRIENRWVQGRVYDALYVGPTLRVRPGDRIELALANRLGVPTNLHFHGFHVSPSGNSDNVFLEIMPGQVQQYVVDIPKTHDPGTFWYHAHFHGLTEGQVFGGMSGLIVVEGLRELLPPPLRDLHERVVALKDFQVQNGAIPSVNIDSDAPTTRTVNGQIEPAMGISPGETQLWRLGNIGADIWYRLKLDGHRFHVIAEDANPVWEVWSADELVLPPGKRYDVLVQGAAAETYALRTLYFDQGPDGDQYPEKLLATLRSVGPRRPPAALPTAIWPNRDLKGATIAQRRQIVFSENPNTNQFFIDGKQFDMNRVDVQPKLGTVEEWTIRNVTRELHPFHIHINDFQVMSINGRPYPAKSRQDTVPLPLGGDVVIRIPFQDFTGKFVFHCHILAHEDNGMMAVVQVVP